VEEKGRVVLVTGGGRGLGEAVCQTLSSAGASVIVADIRPDIAEKVALDIQGKEAMALPLDVSNESKQKPLSKGWLQYGHLDVLTMRERMSRLD